MSQLMATLTDAFSLLSGRGRPLSKVQEEAPELKYESPLPPKLWTIGEVTRVHRSVAPGDHGRCYSSGRFYSEVYPIEYTCLLDDRKIPDINGGPTRLYGRPPRNARA
jgi:hypothetical protein